MLMVAHHRYWSVLCNLRPSTNRERNFSVRQGRPDDRLADMKPTLKATLRHGEALEPINIFPIETYVNFGCSLRGFPLHGTLTVHITRVRNSPCVNVNKSKVMVCERSRSEVVAFVCPYKVGIACEKECKITLNGEDMEEVNELKYLGSVMCKHDGTEGETRERTL